MIGCAPGLTGPTVAPSTVRSAPEDSDLLGVIPGEAEVVLAIDVQQLRQSRWTAEVLAAHGRIADATTRGFDQVRDVDQMVLARLPGAAGGSTVTVAQGRFDASPMVAAFRAARPGAAASSFRGCPVQDADGEAMAFLTPRTMIAGSLAAVRAAIDASLGRAPAIRDQAWFEESTDELAAGRGRRARGPAVLLAVRPGDEMRAALGRELPRADTLARVAARLDLGERLDLSAVGVAGSRADATELAVQLQHTVRSLRGRPSLAALGLGPVLDGVRLGVDGARVRAQVGLREDQREAIALRLAELAALLGGGQPPAPPGDAGAGLVP